MDSISDDLLKLQARFDQWWANRRYNREPIPDQLRDAALEMSRRYPPSLLQRVLKIQLCSISCYEPASIPFNDAGRLFAQNQRGFLCDRELTRPNDAIQRIDRRRLYAYKQLINARVWIG